ncbi:MAG: hypothetical protein ABDH49_04030 [Candidatus Hydrothermales bacterium]
MDRGALFLISLILFSCSNPIERSKRLLEKGRYNEAEGILLYSLKKGESSQEIFLLLGEIYVKKGHYLSAINYFEKILDKKKYKDRLVKNLREIFNETKSRGSEIAKRAISLIFLISPESLTFDEKKFVAYLLIEKEQSELYTFIENLLSEKFDDELYLTYIKFLYEKGKNSSIFYVFDKFKNNVLNSELRLSILFYVGTAYYKEGERCFDQGKVDSSNYYLSKYIEMGVPEIYLPKAYFLRGKLNLIKEDTMLALYDLRKVIEILPFKNSDIAQEARELIKELKLKGF